MVSCLDMVVFFFFKQKTAYEIQYGLVGSEMCIRDRVETDEEACAQYQNLALVDRFIWHMQNVPGVNSACLLYTSDAADERSSVDLGGRRIIKKKTSTEHGG